MPCEEMQIPSELKAAAALVPANDKAPLTLLDLPNEIILEIADHLDWTRDDDWDLDELPAMRPIFKLSGVNPRFRALIGPRILGTVYCPYHAWGAIPPLFNSQVASWVRTLRIELFPSNGRRNLPQNPYNALWRALASLPRLRALFITVSPTVLPNFATAFTSCLEQTTTRLGSVEVVQLPCSAVSLLHLCPNASLVRLTCPHQDKHYSPRPEPTIRMHHYRNLHPDRLSKIVADFHPSHHVPYLDYDEWRMWFESRYGVAVQRGEGGKDKRVKKRGGI